MWLLDWLVARYYNVLDWFGDWYWTFRNRVANLPSSLLELRNTIISYYNMAVSSIGTAINNFYQAYIQPSITWLVNSLNYLNSYFGNVIANIQGYLAGIPSQLQAWYNSLVSWATNTFANAITSLQNWLGNVANSIIPQIQANLNTLMNFKAWLDAIKALLTPEWLKELINWYNANKNNLTVIVSNPVGSIAGFLWGILLDLLEYKIAYALGTVQYPLPQIPNWGTGAGGTYEIPLSSSGELGRPLKTLYVSGYTFNPNHKGVDYGAVAGEPVYASHSGVVEFAGWNSYGYGNMVDLRSDKYWSRYAHLQMVNVVAGQTVPKGYIIGFADSTGNSTGDHLHFELRINGVPVDPLVYIQ